MVLFATETEAKACTYLRLAVICRSSVHIHDLLNGTELPRKPTLTFMRSGGYDLALQYWCPYGPYSIGSSIDIVNDLKTDTIESISELSEALLHKEARALDPSSTLM